MAVDVNSYAVIADNFVELYTTKYSVFNKDEKYNGITKKHYEYLNLKLVLRLISILKYEHEVKKVKWETLIKKYNLVKLRDKLVCCGIDFEKLIKLSNLPKIVSYTNNDDIGIETIDVEQTLEISPLEIQIYQNNTLNYDRITKEQLKKEICLVNKLCCERLVNKKKKIKFIKGFVNQNCKPINL